MVETTDHLHLLAAVGRLDSARQKSKNVSVRRRDAERLLKSVPIEPSSRVDGGVVLFGSAPETYSVLCFWFIVSTDLERAMRIFIRYNGGKKTYTWAIAHFEDLRFWWNWNFVSTAICWSAEERGANFVVRVITAFKTIFTAVVRLLGGRSLHDKLVRKKSRLHEISGTKDVKRRVPGRH
jgi:hypothetical protein